MLTLIKLVINWFSTNYKAVAVGLICLLIATVSIQYNQLQRKNREINRIEGNIRAYEQIAMNKDKVNRVLQLTIQELNQSKDSLITTLNEQKKKLKIKDKNLTTAAIVNIEVKDSIKTVIKHKLIDFNEELKLNPLTTVTVSRKDSILSAKLHILNQQTLFIEDKKEYKNRYKNFFSRLLHFDWKRIRVKKYTITNSNPLIVVTDTRVVEVAR